MIYEEFLKNEGYTDIRFIGQNQWIAIGKYTFTHAILLGTVGDIFCFDNRWCYHSYNDAKRALDKWNGIGEPNGWHRHPLSGRRRENGDADLEYINY